MRQQRIVDLARVPIGDPVGLAGRLVEWQAVAADLWQGCLDDGSGTVAIAASTSLAAQAGDLVILSGRRGEGSIDVHSLQRVRRPLRSFPSAEWRRLHDPAQRQRLRDRAMLMRVIREFFAARDFLEVETGQLVDEPGQEPTLEWFRAQADRFLITSPELRMKRLLAAGYERIFDLSHCFRRGLGERSRLHHPEFTMLEWYRAWEDEEAIIRDLEELLPEAAARLRSAAGLCALPSRVEFAAPFERLSVEQAFARHAGVDLSPLLDRDAERFRAEARRAGVRAVRDGEDPHSLFFRIFLDHVEPHLGRSRPTVLDKFPASMAALAEIDALDPRCARRFECYAGGVELANAFFELTDPTAQRQRFEVDRLEKRAAGGDPGPFPECFLAALEEGLPPSAGIALGVDRLLMLIVGATRIDDVLAFPDPLV